MTTLFLGSTQLKATLLGSFWARGGRPDPAKLLKGNFDEQGAKARRYFGEEKRK